MPDPIISFDASTFDPFAVPQIRPFVAATKDADSRREVWTLGGRRALENEGFLHNAMAPAAAIGPLTIAAEPTPNVRIAPPRPYAEQFDAIRITPPAFDPSHALAGLTRLQRELAEGATAERRAQAERESTLVCEVQRLRAGHDRALKRAEQAEAGRGRAERRQRLQLLLTGAGVFVACVAVVLANHLLG